MQIFKLCFLEILFIPSWHDSVYFYVGLWFSGQQGCGCFEVLNTFKWVSSFQSFKSIYALGSKLSYVIIVHYQHQKGLIKERVCLTDIFKHAVRRQTIICQLYLAQVYTQYTLALSWVCRKQKSVHSESGHCFHESPTCILSSIHILLLFKDAICNFSDEPGSLLVLVSLVLTNGDGTGKIHTTSKCWSWKTNKQTEKSISHHPPTLPKRKKGWCYY